MANETGKTLPSTGLMDLIRLICGLLRALMPNRYFLNPGLVLSDWIRDLARRRSTEGIIPALEPSHALAHVMKIAPDLPKDHIIVMNMCGRGDKDIFTVAKHLGFDMAE